MPLLSRKVTNIVAETRRKMTQNIKHKLHGLNARCTVRPRELWKTEDYTPPEPDRLPHGKTQRDLDRRGRVKRKYRSNRNKKYTKKFDATLGYPGEGPGHVECKTCDNGARCPIAGHYHRKTKPLSQAVRRKREAAKTKPKKRKEVEYELCQSLTNDECRSGEHAHDATQTLNTPETMEYLLRTEEVKDPPNSPIPGVATIGTRSRVLHFRSLAALSRGEDTSTLNSSEYPQCGEEANASITGDSPCLGGSVDDDDDGDADDAIHDVDEAFINLYDLTIPEPTADDSDDVDNELTLLHRVTDVLLGDGDVDVADDAVTDSPPARLSDQSSVDPPLDNVSLTDEESSSAESETSSDDDDTDSSSDEEDEQAPLLDPVPVAPPLVVDPPVPPQAVVPVVPEPVKRVKIFCANPGGERPNVLGQWCNTLKWGFHVVNPFSVSVQTMEVNTDLAIGITELQDYTTANRQAYHMGFLGCASGKRWSAASSKHVAEFFASLYPLTYDADVYTELVEYLLTDRLLAQRRCVSPDGTITDIMTPVKYFAGKHPRCSQYMKNRQVYIDTLIHVTNQLLMSGLMEWTANPGVKAQIHFRRADRLQVSPCTDPSSG